MLNYMRTIAGFNRSVRLLLLGWALVQFSYFGVIAVLQNLYLLRLGFGLGFIGLLVGVGQFTLALSALPAGEFGRRFGTRTALLLGFFLVPAGYTLFMLVEWLPKEWWANWLLACWALVWLGAALALVNVYPHWMAVAAVEVRHHVFAAQSAVSAAGAFLGSLVGGLLAAALAGWLGPADPAGPYRDGLFVAMLVMWLGLLAVARTDAGQTARIAQSSRGGASAPWALFVLVGTATTLISLSDGSVRAFFTVYMDRGYAVSADQIGLVLGLAQVLAFGISLAAPILTRRLGAGVAWAAAALGLGVAVALTAFPGEWRAASAGYIGMLGASTIAIIARNVYCQEKAPAAWRPTMSAVTSIGLSLGWGISAAAGGYLIGMVGYSGFFILGAFAAVMATPIIVSLMRRRVMGVAIAASE